MRLILAALTVLWVTLKRVARSYRTVSALLLGLALATGTMATVPIYSGASLQKSFVAHWLEEGRGRPPFTLILTYENERRATDVPPSSFGSLSSSLDGSLRATVGQEPQNRATFLSLGGDAFLPQGSRAPDLLSRSAELCSMSNLGDVAEVIQGRWYAEREDGVLEVVVDESAFESLELTVGGRYVSWYEMRLDEAASRGGGGYLQIPCEVVGVFRSLPGRTTREWIYPPPFSGRLFVDPTVFASRLLGEEGLRVAHCGMQWVFDESRVRVDDLGEMIRGLEVAESRAAAVLPGSSFWWSPTAYFRSFERTMRSVSLFLLSLAAPIMGMVLYYVILMAGIAVEHRQTELAVLQSRGAGRGQLMASFLLEWLLLGSLAAIAGPPIGLLFTRAMGGSAGFLSFVDRAALPAILSRSSLRYAAVASLCAVAAASVPVAATFRHSIVTLRREQGRLRSRTLWHRAFLDVVLLALAAFGYRALEWQSFAVSPGAAVEADPVLFLVPVAFILGSGLLLLRLLPLVMAGLGLVAERFRGVVWQLTFRRLQGNAERVMPLLLLLAMTAALGIYSASAARTLARNLEDRIRYDVGADLATREEWAYPAASSSVRAARTASLSEPPFLSRKDLPGVSEAARVLTGEVTVERRGGLQGEATMMAIVPGEFARTAWSRADWNDARLVDYCGLLSRHPEGVILSRELRDSSGLSLGDTLTIGYKGQSVEVTVAGDVRYWPSLDPARGPFLIMNLEFLQEQVSLEPYGVWYRLEDRGTVQEIVSELAGQGVYVTEVRDAASMLVELLREPYRMGFFGILSIGFLVSAAVTVLGFLISTFFSVKGRQIHFGALRANGLSVPQLVAIVSLEQLISLGLGLGMGVLLGRLCTRLFLPFLKARAGGLGAAPPFLIVTSLGDLRSILLVSAGVFAAAVLGLSLYLSRRKLFAALRMGEDQ